MDMTIARAPDSGSLGIGTAALEDRVASAVERIFAVMVDADAIVGDRVLEQGALAAYCDELGGIADVAGGEDNQGLQQLCQQMMRQVDGLRHGDQGMSAATHALLMEWPDLLIGFLANPEGWSGAEALLVHLQDPLWPAAADSLQAESLRGLLRGRCLHPVGPTPDCVCSEHPGLAEDLPAGNDACEEFQSRPGEDGAQRVVQESPADGVSGSEPAEKEVAEIFNRAEAAGLLGLQEVCMRVMQNVELLAPTHSQQGTPAGDMLASFSFVANEYLASPGDAAAADLLVDFLCSDIWPEQLAADERESLKLILLEGQGDPLAAVTAADPLPVVIEADEPGDGTANDAALLDEQIDPQPQTINDELIGMLTAELSDMRSELEQLLPAAEVSEAGNGTSTEAVETYAELIQRLGVAAEAVGLAALQNFLGSVYRRLVTEARNGLSSRQSNALAVLPGSILAYLAAPEDSSTGEGLLDLLRGDTWARPPSAAHAASLLLALSMVEITKDSVGAEARQKEALPENVSLALPTDLSQELLEGLLQEMPLHTSEFSACIQRLAAGSGTMKDVDSAKRAAHTLKGAGNTVGIKGIANLTHHVEDILVALSKYQILPGRKMAAMLTNAGDCLEAMGEAVMGTGPEPEYALAVLQDVLDWANRIDRDGVPEDDAPAAAAPRGEASAPSGSESESESAANAASAQTGEAMIRVPAGLVDELLRLVGETIISTGQVRERLQRLQRQNKTIRAQNGVFLQLATELEELVDLRGAAAGFGTARDDDEFDPLEFEHYGELHTVSRRLIEAATDTGELSAEVHTELGSLGELVDVQNRLHEESQNAVMRTRMVSVATVVSRLQRSVRQASRLLDKHVALNVLGADTMIDSNILNELVDPMMHMLRNSVDHGIESPEQRAAAGKDAEGHIELAFSREGNQVVVRCRDDGAGLNLEAVRRTAESRGMLASDQTLSDDEMARLILAPGFSTRSESTQMSGRGVGMDVVYSRVLQLKGGLNLNSAPGRGLEIELRLPAMLISTHALLVRSRARVFAISSYGVQDIRYVTLDQVQKVGGESFFRINEELRPIADLDDLLNLKGERRGDDRKGGFPALMVRDDSGAVHAVRVQEIIDSRSLVVKNLGRFVPKPHGVVGATILGDGSVAAVIDIPELMRKPVRRETATELDEGRTAHDASAAAGNARLTAMVVDDSLSARRATAQFMKDAGYEVRTAIDGLEAVAILDKWKPGILLVDMEMPRMNGLELTAHVRARPDTEKIPVIMITSRSTEKHRRQAEAAGVNVYLTKPFGDDQLLRHISELVTA